VRFVKYLLCQVGGALVLIWDGAPIHRRVVIKEFLTTTAGQQVQIEQLPGYAPELNPDEGGWHQLKQVEWKNVCCHNLQALRHELQLAAARLQRKRDILLGCIKQCGY